MTLAFAEGLTARHSQVFPSSASDGWRGFAASLVRSRYRLSSCLSPWRSWPGLLPANQDFYFRAFRRVGRPSRGRIWLRWQL